MKRVLNFGSLLLILALVWGGCGKDPKMEKPDEDAANRGYFSLNIGEVVGSFEVITKADDPNKPDPNDFNVRVFGQTLRGTSYDTTWAKYSDMPAVVSIPAGNYTIEAFNGEQKTGFNSPYYYGKRDLNVGIQEMIETEIVCRLACVKVSVEFTSLFKSNVKNGICLIRSLTDEFFLEVDEEHHLIPGYVAVPSDGKLIVTVSGTYVEDGSRVDFTSTIPDVEARQWHQISLSVNTAAGIENSGSMVKVDHTVDEKEFGVLVPGGDDVIDNNGDQGSWEDDPNVPDVPDTPDPVEPDKEAIVIAGVGFDIDKELTVSAGEQGVTVDVKMDAEKGIDKLEVAIVSPALTEEALSGIGLGGNFDVANPSEEVKSMLIELGLLQAGDDIKGKTSHVFSVGSFMPLLGQLDYGVGNIHRFNLTVTDGDGNVVKKTLTVNLTE